MLLTTANIMNRPLMPQAKVLEDIGTAKRYSTVIGWQEINPARYKQAIRTAGDGHWAHAQLDTPIPISVNADYYEIVSSEKYRTHKGRALASPSRWITWAIVRRRTDGLLFVVVNTHFVSGAWNAKKKLFKGWRKKMWRLHFAALHTLVAELRTHGYTVLVVGDFNKVNVPELTGRQKSLVPGGIDKILVLPSPQGPDFRLLNTWEHRGHSDHPQRTVRLRLRAG